MLYIAGLNVPLACEAIPDNVGHTFGYYDPKSGVITLDSATTLSRSRRALIHELLHVVDEAYDLGLTHRQVRGVAAGLASFWEDRRNTAAVEFLTGGPSLCRP